MGDLALTFHFPPGALWEMDAQELRFWHGQALRIAREREAG